jgi:hypothetical protein
MSKMPESAPEAPFFDLYAAGKALPDEIDDFVERWHKSRDKRTLGLELHEYLGLSWDEYALWIQDPDSLPQILIARRERRPLAKVIEDYLDEPLLAARAADTTTLAALRAWLARVKSSRQR